jgi:hypothetical protein
MEIILLLLSLGTCIYLHVFSYVYIYIHSFIFMCISMSPLQYTPAAVKPAVTQGGYQGYQQPQLQAQQQSQYTQQQQVCYFSL